jgi:hypothetical protein
MRVRERDGLFDIVRSANARAVAPCLVVPAQAGTHWPVIMDPGSPPAVRASAGTTVVARRTNLWLWETMSGGSPCFRPVLYREPRNRNVSCRQSSRGTRAATPALVAQPNRNVESPAAVRECRAVEARRPEHRGGIVREAVALLGLAEQAGLHLRLILAVLS